MDIKQKSKLRQFFCKHDYQEGLLHTNISPVFINLNGRAITTICVRCGKIKHVRMVPW